MRRILLMPRSIFVLFLVLGSSVVAKGQEFAGVTGTISDVQQGAVPGVKVDVDNAKTGLHLSTVSNDQGQYQFQRLAPGPAYVLTFTKDGFRTFKLDNLTFGVNTISLPPGRRTRRNS